MPLQSRDTGGAAEVPAGKPGLPDGGAGEGLLEGKILLMVVPLSRTSY